ncbi:MAG: site-specific integrase [Paludibacteraceae bacterium]|nr:site-specific integrase [Paludibacteraceae bacterium]
MVTRNLILPNPPHALVRVYPKKLKQNNYSLYLDYMDRGVRHQKCMRIYLMDESRLKGVFRKEAQLTNLQNIANAMKIRMKKEEELLKQSISIENSGSKILLANYLNDFISESEKCRQGGSYARTLRNVQYHLVRFLGDKLKEITLYDISPNFCRKFIDYFRKALKPNKKALSPTTSSHYISFFRSLLENAVKDDLILLNPFSKLKKYELIKRAEYCRSVLTESEVEKLKRTPCLRENVAKAFFFSCYTSLRISDIRALKWGNLRFSAKESRMELIMQKTGKFLSMNISPKALMQLPQKVRGPEDLVFDLPGDTCLGRVLKIWTQEAKVQKKVTFHTARHTFGTFLSKRGVNMQTIQKLMGHKSIISTSFYVEVTDKDKEKAIALL